MPSESALKLGGHCFSIINPDEKVHALVSGVVLTELVVVGTHAVPPTDLKVATENLLVEDESLTGVATKANIAGLVLV